LAALQQQQQTHSGSNIPWFKQQLAAQQQQQQTHLGMNVPLSWPTFSSPAAATADTFSYKCTSV